MKAIILAAGIGQRLGKNGENQPKCLLRFDNQSLLERHLTYLRLFQIDEIFIAVGYQAEIVQHHISMLGLGDWVSTIYNPAYTQGSLISLWTLRTHLAAGDDVILMDADVLYDVRILGQLCRTHQSNCFLLDREFEMGEEPVKLCVKGQQLVEFRKQIAADLSYDFAGESVGFFRFSSAIASRLAEQLEHYVSAKRYEEPYEEAIRDLLLETPDEFGYEEITGLPWIEIDFPEDIQKAQKIILPNLHNEAHMMKYL